MFEFRPKVDREAEPRSLDFEQVPIVVVSNAPGFLSDRPRDGVPAVRCTTHLESPLGGSDLPFLPRDSDLDYDDHESENRPGAYIASVGSPIRSSSTFANAETRMVRTRRTRFGPPPHRRRRPPWRRRPVARDSPRRTGSPTRTSRGSCWLRRLARR